MFITQCRHKQEFTTIQFPGKPEAPLSVKKEHEALLDKIQKISLFQNSAGHVAIKLRELMQQHFAEEEDYALPPLGLLPLLAGANTPEQSKDVLLLTGKPKPQTAHLSAEHQMVKAYLDELKQVTTKKNYRKSMNPKKHFINMRIPKKKFFPAAILIGEYLKRKSATKP